MAYLTRGAKLWLGVRVIVSAVFLAARVNPLRLSGEAVVAIVVLSVVLGIVETYRLREQVLLANFAVAPAMLGVMFAVPAIIGEYVLRTASVVLS